MVTNEAVAVLTSGQLMSRAIASRHQNACIIMNRSQLVSAALSCTATEAALQHHNSAHPKEPPGLSFMSSGTKASGLTRAAICATLAQARGPQIHREKYQMFGSTNTSVRLIRCRPFHDRFNHLIAQPHGFWESWCEKLLNRFETIAVSLESTK